LKLVVAAAVAVVVELLLLLAVAVAVELLASRLLASRELKYRWTQSPKQKSLLSALDSSRNCASQR